MCVCVCVYMHVYVYTLYMNNVLILPFSDDEPIYENPPAKYSAERILHILLDKAIPSDKICTKRPTNVTGSASFVVDITKLADPDDVKKDNFGVWSHSGSHVQSFDVSYEEGCCFVEKCDSSTPKDNIVVLRRLHSFHPLNNQFKRMIASIG